MFIVSSQMQVLQVYAQNVTELEADKNTGVQQLNAVEQVINIVVDQLGEKINDEEKSDL
jgi:hypothetical protein